MHPIKVFFFRGQPTGDDWTAAEGCNNMNWFQLKATLLTLQAFCSDFRNVHIRLMAIACINKYGSTKEHLFHLTREVYEWVMCRNITLSVAHIPGCLNIRRTKSPGPITLMWNGCWIIMFFSGCVNSLACLKWICLLPG